MANLLTETKENMKYHGLSPEDIVHIGTVYTIVDKEYSHYACTWEEFTALADHEYDDDYGAPYVAQDLVIVFSNGCWMTRAEYDGSEWWQYHEPPKVPQGPAKPITALMGEMFSDISDYHEELDCEEMIE